MTIRIGLMGFGRVARELYRLAARQSDDVEIVAMADIAAPSVLEYLVNEEGIGSDGFELTGNWLDAGRFRTRMLQISDPHEVPWDALGADVVVEATGRFCDRNALDAHIANGAHRALLATLPAEPLDRLVIPGVNQNDATVSDRRISVGSATTTAFALMVRVLDDAFGVAHASMTTVHNFTSDQPAQDSARDDPRRSRAAGKNIIPNGTDTPKWVGEILPHLEGRLSGYALNVPVQKGSLLDLSVVFERRGVDSSAINATFAAARAATPELIGIAEDPIVSSDIIDRTHSVTIDAHATLGCADRIAKVLGWYDARGHAARILDVVRHYADLDQAAGDPRL